MKLQGTFFSMLFLSFLLVNCANPKKPIVQKQKSNPQITLDSITDTRDGAIYKTITIGNQIWFAENLRFDVPGSMLNPDNPSISYGRLYTLTAAQNACPEGWHLPSDREWNLLELAHGMPPEDALRGGWRGTHGTAMKSTTDWGDNNIITDSLEGPPINEYGNGTNQLGFNVRPAGYYFSGQMGGEKGMQGLGYSAAFWSSVENGVGCARFLFSPKKWVNKWEDKDNETGAGLSCRCVKD